MTGQSWNDVLASRRQLSQKLASGDEWRMEVPPTSTFPDGERLKLASTSHRSTLSFIETSLLTLERSDLVKVDCGNIAKVNRERSR